MRRVAGLVGAVTVLGACSIAGSPEGRPGPGGALEANGVVGCVAGVSRAVEERGTERGAASELPDEGASAEARAAALLFDARRWDEAAVAFHRVARGETDDTPRERQVARYRVAVALDHLGLHQASLRGFAAIADDPRHPRFQETLVRLAGLATIVPDPDEVVALLGRYGPVHAAVYDNEAQRELHAHLVTLLGWSAYRAGRFEDAIAAFAKVPPDTPYVVPAELLAALAFGQLRQAGPAIAALERLQAVLEQRPPSAERARLLDLVHLSIGRAQWARAIVAFDPAHGNPTIDGRALAAAVASFRSVDPAGASWPDALFGAAWAYFMAGDIPIALGHLDTLESPRLWGVVHPEVPVLGATMELALCHFDEAETRAARVVLRYAPVRREIAATVARLDAEGGPSRFARFAEEVRANGAGFGPETRAVVEAALSDRPIALRFAHARAVEADIALLARMPAALRTSALGRETADTLDAARDAATQEAGAMVRARIVRAIHEIDQQLARARAVVVDVARGRAARPRLRVAEKPPPAFPFGVSPDHEHVLWPFDGEHWDDELATYRVLARSRCGD